MQANLQIFPFAHLHICTSSHLHIKKNYLGNVGQPQPLKIPQDDRHKATPITITATATSKILFFNIIKSYRSYQYTKYTLCGANGIGKQVVPTAVTPGKHVSLQ
jgi:hypothetical protein